MFTHQRIEEIQNKIKNSKILSNHERTDWMNLLDLMNDKQLRELEEILDKENFVDAAPQSVSAPAAPASAPVPRPVQQVQSQAQPPLPPKPQPAPAAPPAPKPAPQPTPKQTPPPQPPKLEPIAPLPPLKHIANIPGVAGPQPQKIIQHNAEQGANSSQSSAPAKTQQSAEPLRSTTTTPFKLEHPEDIKAMTARDLRNYDLQSLVNEIKKNIAEHGYFPVLQLLEQSPLYESYIKSGEMKLKGLPADLNQSEFEFVTDLLIHMRFNKW